MWTTPLVKQCFVTAGVSINLMTHGIFIGFSTVLLPQLKQTKQIYIDDTIASWIASIHQIPLIVGILSTPLIMRKYGRRTASIASAILMTVGWLIISGANSSEAILTARFIQGVAIGFTAFIGYILIGEYTTPKYRGVFLTIISISRLFGCTSAHFLGYVLSWQQMSLLSAIITFLDLVISLYSPESPSFYLINGRYEECKRAFHWLRGHEDDAELDKLIKTEMNKKALGNMDEEKSVNIWVVRKLKDALKAIKKKEVYKSLIIMAHLYALNEWNGGVIFDYFATDVINSVVGTNANHALIILSIDLQRLISSVCGILFVKKLRRRLILILSTTMTLVCYCSVALYVYLRTHNMLAFDHPLVGTLLIHLHMFSLAIGGSFLPVIIAGEIFPLEHRGVCGMISVLFFSVNLMININTFLHLFSRIGIHGAYTVYASLMLYFLIILLFIMPETKDKTLQDIEEELRGETLYIQAQLITETQYFADESLKNIRVSSERTSCHRIQNHKQK